MGNKRSRPSAGKRSRRAPRRAARPAAPATPASAPVPPTSAPAPSSPEPAAGKAGGLQGVLENEPVMIALLGAMAIVSYLPAILWGGFVWDDVIFTEAASVRDADGIFRLWFTPRDGLREEHYWPMTYSTFWLEHKLWGFEPMGYHAVNVALHVLNTALLLRILKHLAVPGALLAAAVFALHPVHVDSVAWVMERKDVLSGAFYLATVLVWLKHLDQPSRGRYALALVLLAFGMLSKAVVVTLPIVLIILGWWKTGRLQAYDFERLVPLFVVAFGIALGDFIFLNVVADRSSFDFGPIDRLLIAARAGWFYIAKLLVPINLVPIYPFWEVTDAVSWLALIGAIGLLAVLWYWRETLGRGPLAGILFFAVTLAPMLGFVDHVYMKFSFVADRFQYLASIGPIVVIAGLISAATARMSQPGGLLVLALAGLAGLGFLTWQQSTIYQDGLTFYGHIVERNPGARGAQQGYGRALREAGRLEEALVATSQAVTQYPDVANGHVGHALVLNDLGRFDEARYYYREALKLDPDNDAAQKGFAKLLLSQDPNNQEAQDNLAKLLGDVSQGDIHSLLPTDIADLAGLRFGQERFDEMLELLDVLVEMEPDDHVAHANRGLALYKLERYEEAVASFDRSLALKPGFEMAIDGRKAVLEEMGPTFVEHETTTLSR